MRVTTKETCQRFYHISEEKLKVMDAKTQFMLEDTEPLSSGSAGQEQLKMDTLLHNKYYFKS